MSPRLPARFGLRAKLLSGAAVLLAFTAVIGVLGIRANAESNASSKRMFEGSVKPLSELGIARAKFNENRAFTNNHILERTAAEKAKLVDKIKANGAVVDKNLAEVKASLRTDHGQQLFTELAAAVNAYRDTRGEVLALSDAGKEQEAYALNKQKLLPLVRNAADAFNGLFDSKVALAATEQRENRGDRLFGAHARDRAAARGDRGRLRDGAVVLAPVSSARSGRSSTVSRRSGRAAPPICARRSRRSPRAI